MDKVEIMASLALVLWTFFKATTWSYWRRSAKLERLFEALEIGVAAAWEQVVKPYLEEHGKNAPLPDSIRQHAERVAVAEAAKVDGIVSKFAAPIIRATLKMAVEEAKRRGGK